MAKGMAAASNQETAHAMQEDEGGDLAEQVVMALVRCLADSGPAGVHLLRKLIGSLEDMGDAVMQRDHGALGDAADAAHQVLSNCSKTRKEQTMASYTEEVARWRMQRDQQKVQERVGMIVDEYRQAVRDRDTALANGDGETAAFADDDCIQLEKEYLSYCPPQPPQWDPRDLEYLHRKKAFRERHGAAADAAIGAAHSYVTRPRLSNLNTNTLNEHGMGIRANTPQYYRRMNDLLEMYSAQGGLHYDPNEETLTPTEAAKISGISAQSYNNASHALARQGRFRK
jgi:hypothetical protein